MNPFADSAAGDPTTPLKDQTYERLLEQLNEDVEPVKLPGTPEQPTEPVVLVVGIPRSGSTLLSQVLAASGAFGYCTNLVARFYRNPGFGVRVQRLLEPVLPRDSMTFESYRGRTTRWFEPHEFGYFWERFLPFDDHHDPDDAQLESVDWDGMRRDLAAMQWGLGGPMMVKNLILSFVAGAIGEAIPEVRFVEIRRRPLEVANSNWRARVAEYDDPQQWLSTRPADWKELEETLEAPEQIAVMMRRLGDALEQARRTLGADRWHQIDYHDLCEHPDRTVHDLVDAFDLEVDPDVESFPDRFDASGVRELDGTVNDRLETALRSEGIGL